jgi:lipid A disaccharide synthetase
MNNAHAAHALYSMCNNFSRLVTAVNKRSKSEKPKRKNRKKSVADINLSKTQKKAILNKIAELTNHGLNSVEIAIYMPTVYKAQLIRIIKDLIEKKK